MILAALAPAATVEVLDEAGSSNAVAAERARSGAPEGLTVAVEHQSAGRGRLDRTWQTPARAALTFSVVLRPQVPAAAWPWLPLLTGHTVTATLRAAGYDAGVKWPNDVLIGDQKVAGILVERVETPTGPAAVIGIGLNVDLSAEELPVPTATSLALQPGGAPDRSVLLLALVGDLLMAYDDWQSGGEEARGRLATAYSAACVTVGREVRVELPGGDQLVGRATAVDPSGRLVVMSDGRATAVGAGDVVHVRPADR